MSEKSREPQNMLRLSADIPHLSRHMRSLTLWPFRFYHHGLRHHGSHTRSATEAGDVPDLLAKLRIMMWGFVFLQSPSRNVELGGDARQHETNTRIDGQADGWNQTLHYI